MNSKDGQKDLKSLLREEANFPTSTLWGGNPNSKGS